MALPKKTLAEQLAKIKETFSSSTIYKPEEYYSCGEIFHKACGVPGPIMGHINMNLGHSNSSKTTAMILAAKNAQSIGHLPVFIITEKKWSWKYATNLGLEATKREDGSWDGHFIFNDSFRYIEEVTDFINKLITEQEKGNLPYSLLFCWDSVGSIPCKMSFEGAGGSMHDARVLADKIGKGLSGRITASKKADYPYYNTLLVINQPWVATGDNIYDPPEIKAKGGEAMWLASALVFLFGKQKKSGISQISATKNARKVVFAIRTKISVIKNHVNGMQFQDGKVIVTPHGYIEDSTKSLEEYKKKYSSYWKEILEGDGEITLTDSTDYIENIAKISDDTSDYSNVFPDDSEDSDENMFD